MGVSLEPGKLNSCQKTLNRKRRCKPIDTLEQWLRSPAAELLRAELQHHYSTQVTGTPDEAVAELDFLDYLVDGVGPLRYFGFSAELQLHEFRSFDGRKPEVMNAIEKWPVIDTGMEEHRISWSMDANGVPRTLNPH